MLGSREALLEGVFACSDWELSPLAFAQIGRITVCFIELKFRKIHFIVFIQLLPISRSADRKFHMADVKETLN